MLAETPVTQHSPCYSAVSSSLTNPLTACSNYSPFCHPTTSLRFNTSLVSSGQTLYLAALLETNASLLKRFTAESSRELRRNAVPRQQAEASVDVPYPPLQIVNSVLFCLLSLYLYLLTAPLLNSLSSPSPPSFISLLINSLSS